jgi:hypothetical protein
MVGLKFSSLKLWKAPCLINEFVAIPLIKSIGGQAYANEAAGECDIKNRQ